MITNYFLDTYGVDPPIITRDQMPPQEMKAKVKKHFH